MTRVRAARSGPAFWSRRSSLVLVLVFAVINFFAGFYFGKQNKQESLSSLLRAIAEDSGATAEAVSAFGQQAQEIVQKASQLQTSQQIADFLNTPEHLRQTQKLMMQFGIPPPRKFSVEDIDQLISLAITEFRQFLTTEDGQAVAQHVSRLWNMSLLGIAAQDMKLPMSEVYNSNTAKVLSSALPDRDHLLEQPISQLAEAMIPGLREFVESPLVESLLQKTRVDDNLPRNPRMTQLRESVI